MQCGKFSPEALEELANFNNAYQWWTTLYPFRELCKVARIALSLTASVAAVDRVFSHHGRVHQPLRSRLHDTTVNKVVFVSQLLRTKTRYLTTIWI